MSSQQNTNLPVPVDRVRTLTSPNRRNLLYLAMAMLLICGVTIAIGMGS